MQWRWLVVVGLVGWGCGGGEAGRPAAGGARGEPGEFPEWALAAFAPLPAVIEAAENPVTEAKVGLGRRLFEEVGLSAARDVACSSCHPLDRWGTVRRGVTPGDRCRGWLDAPTVYNAAAQVDLFWDGRAHTVEEQVRQSLLSAVEMGWGDEAALAARVRGLGGYEAAFRAAFPGEAEPQTVANVAKALGAFERRLVTPSRWDEFLRGNRDALTAAEKQGFTRFVAAGCSDCHNGMAVGGRMFQVLGEARPWPLQADSGRIGVTGKREDLFLFKVPALRNVEHTGPYFDHGLVTDLGEAVRLMARYQRGMALTESDVAEILVWLKTLSGTPPKDLVPTAADQ